MAGQRTRSWLLTVVAVVRRPGLWKTAVVQVWRLARPGYRAWLRFRLQTHYGDAGHPPVPADVVSWLHWCQSMDRSRR